jgi:hypothetical protein
MIAARILRKGSQQRSIESIIMSPTVILGTILAVIAIFILGYMVTHFVLDRIARRRKTAAAPLPPTLTENGIDRLSIALGVVLVGLAVLLLFVAPSQWAVGTWIVLTILGFAAGLTALARWGKDSAGSNAGAGNPAVFSRDVTLQEKSAPGEMASSARYRNNGAGSNVQTAESIIVPCPNCAQKLRVPRKKSKLIVTCPKCRCSFPYNTDEETPV